MAVLLSTVQRCASLDCMTEFAKDTMEKFRVSLTESEEVLVARIDFGDGHRNHGDKYEAYLANREPIVELLASLGERGGLPDHRVRYWTDPEYHHGRRKESREQMFARNGSVGDEAYVHPGFVKHLRYMLFGAKMPAEMMTAFEHEVGDPEMVSFGDALDLGKFARTLVRRHALEPHQACDEFFRLSLDLGISAEAAQRIRKIVEETR